MTAVELLPRVHEFLGKLHNLFIDGQWVEAIDGCRFATENPATGQELASVARGGPDDIDRAVRVARRAFDERRWIGFSPAQRGRILWKIGDFILEHTEELAQLEPLDNDKPLSTARAGDVPMAADLYRYMAGWVTKLEGSTVPISFPGQSHAYTSREPIGVVGQIILWNYPLALAAWKIAPALATANCVVLKPVEKTPLSALCLAELTCHAGVPDGVVNVVKGYGAEAGAALATHSDVDKAAFTGSTEVVRELIRAAAGNVKKLTLELGGKIPHILFEDADFDEAIQGAADGIFGNQGEACVAGSRLLVHESIADQVIDRVSRMAHAVRLGDGLNPETDMGPSSLGGSRTTYSLPSRLATTRVPPCPLAEKHLPTLGGFSVPPCSPASSPRCGSIATNFRAGRDHEHVPARRRCGGTGQRHTLRTRRGVLDARPIQGTPRCSPAAGRLGVGELLQHGRGHLPFGGYKESGWGREHGQDVLAEYTEVKLYACAYNHQQRRVIRADQTLTSPDTATAVQQSIHHEPNLRHELP
jgi:phenylacetaldehyde dehydrogenase